MTDAVEKEDSELAVTDGGKLFGILAEYAAPSALKDAAKKVRDAGYRNWDTYTPFPVHGIERAMGIKWTVLPWLVFGGGLTGFTTGVTLQWWTNAHDYAWIVSGKPFWSLPANVPVIFELTVLFSALTAFISMLLLNKLPQPASPLDFHERFSTHATDDRFYLVVEASDPKFDEAATRKLLEGTKADLVDDVPDKGVGSTELPTGVVYALIVITAVAAIPFALIALSRESTMRAPRIHAVPDMDWQQKYKAQQRNPFFSDLRASRTDVEGTVAAGALREDDHLYKGKIGTEWARIFPPKLDLGEATMERGRERFGVYCAPCHGLTGSGDGMVHRRALAINAGAEGWVPPTNLHDKAIRYKPVGDIFNTITNGIRNMPAYGRQIAPDDRWAIILYVRALERSRNARLADVPNPGALK